MANNSKANPSIQQQSDADSVGRRSMSARQYPKDCPPLICRWFYAVDSPKRKPNLLKETPKESKPLALPKKYVPFSLGDSRSIESAYQKVVEQNEESRNLEKPRTRLNVKESANDYGLQNTSLSEAGRIKDSGGRVKVPVNEDYLFDVDVEERELAPVYWLGPIYEVRRGSWFFQEGVTLRPCEESLADQLESGYLKVKPYQQPSITSQQTIPQEPASDTVQPSSIPTSQRQDAYSHTPRPFLSPESIQDFSDRHIDKNASSDAEGPSPPTPWQLQTHRLLGSYVNSLVTYQDDTIAWLSHDGIMSRVSSTMYQRFAGGGYLSGVKLVRGYSDPQQKTDANVQPPATANVTSSTIIPSPTHQLARSRLPDISSTLRIPEVSLDGHAGSPASRPESPELSLPKHMVSLIDPSINAESREEAARIRDEIEIQDDYPDRDGEIQSRPIDHLILVTHGIGQRLGMRTESVNFVHDVNVLRQTLKKVYADSPELTAFNKEIDGLPKNCRIQVLPVCWRHLLDFPRRGRQQKRGQADDGHMAEADDDYPRLEDITLEGVPFIRSLITDLALDILLYQSAYREHICHIVLRECNRIYQLFIDRNPQFKGKVSLVGHSLGSLIFYDLCCRQMDDNASTMVRASAESRHSIHQSENARRAEEELQFVFDVEDFYCLGSPIGLFQMLKGRTIAARSYTDSTRSRASTTQTCLSAGAAALSASDTSSAQHTTYINSRGAEPPLSVSSPKCGRLFNIFHPSDPISYRLEPLVDPIMSSVKPQTVPYTKKGIFGASASQGFTSIGNRVGQSVTGLWSSLSSGITNGLLNRNMAGRADPVGQGQPRDSIGSRVADGEAANSSVSSKGKTCRIDASAAARPDSGSISTSPDTDNVETLFQRFERIRQRSTTDLHDSFKSSQTKVEKESRDDQTHDWKIRALNSSGRVDYALQESVLDFNPMNTIASHLSYWSDEDVGHFIMSHLLSETRK